MVLFELLGKILHTPNDAALSSMTLMEIAAKSHIQLWNTRWSATEIIVESDKKTFVQVSTGL